MNACDATHSFAPRTPAARVTCLLALLEILEPNVTLAAGARSLLDADGSAIVLHAMADDYSTDPAGNAGGRIACGVVAK